MGIQIEDGTGSGGLVGVTSNKLRTLSVNIPITFHQSIDEHHQNVYTAIGTATPSSGVVIPFFLQNNDSSLLLVVDRLYVQAVNLTGGTALPNTGAYISLGFGRTYSSGGSAVTPVNQNRTSTNTASVTAYHNNPTLSGTFVEAYRWYAEPSAKTFELIAQKTDDIALGRTNTLEVRYTSDNTGGAILVGIKFFFTDIAHSAP
jgi:hypothetical protein